MNQLHSDHWVIDGAVKQFLRTREAAIYLGLSQQALRKRIKKGEIPARKLPDGDWIVMIADITRYVGLHPRHTPSNLSYVCEKIGAGERIRSSILVFQPFDIFHFFVLSLSQNPLHTPARGFRSFTDVVRSRRQGRLSHQEADVIYGHTSVDQGLAGRGLDAAVAINIDRRFVFLVELRHGLSPGFVDGVWAPGSAFVVKDGGVRVYVCRDSIQEFKELVSDWNEVVEEIGVWVADAFPSLNERLSAQVAADVHSALHAINIRSSQHSQFAVAAQEKAHHADRGLLGFSDQTKNLFLGFDIHRVAILSRFRDIGEGRDHLQRFELISEAKHSSEGFKGYVSWTCGFSQAVGFDGLPGEFKSSDHSRCDFLDECLTKKRVQVIFESGADALLGVWGERRVDVLDSCLDVNFGKVFKEELGFLACVHIEQGIEGFGSDSFSDLQQGGVGERSGTQASAVHCVADIFFASGKVDADHVLLGGIAAGVTDWNLADKVSTFAAFKFPATFTLSTVGADHTSHVDIASIVALPKLQSVKKIPHGALSRLPQRFQQTSSAQPFFRDPHGQSLKDWRAA